jgi:hypothetical protein
MTETHTKPVRLYCFYNWEVSKNGEPFRLCDECIKKQPIPKNCTLVKMAEDCGRECEGVG